MTLLDYYFNHQLCLSTDKKNKQTNPRVFDRRPVTHLRVVSAEVSSATRPEEEKGGEVRDGRHHRGAADLHRLVPAAFHVASKICGWSC